MSMSKLELNCKNSISKTKSKSTKTDLNCEKSSLKFDPKCRKKISNLYSNCENSNSIIEAPNENINASSQEQLRAKSIKAQSNFNG